MTDRTSLPADREMLTCRTCCHHSPVDACCNLTGETRRKDDAACFDHSDGRVIEKAGKVGEE